MKDKEILEKALSVALLEDTPAGALVAAASPVGLVYMSFYGLQDFHTLITNSTVILPKADPWKSFRKLSARCRNILTGSAESSICRLIWYRDVTDFRRKVLLETARIPYGSTAAYGEVAARIHNPNASRAVGGALANNPLVLVVPCHRVLASDGSMHGFSSPGGIATKVKLLELEGCRIVNDHLVA